MSDRYYENLDNDIEEVKKVGVCAECGEDVFDDNSEVYIDDQYNMFCCLECAMRYYGIRKTEDCLVITR